jgi:VIT1/CCC1 family predicted Fe2+/Mn2+ transporter
MAAISSFVLFSMGATVPLLPFFFVDGAAAVLASLGASAAGLFVLGAAITLLTGRSAAFSGLRQLAFGLGAALATFGIGRLVGVAVN